MPSDEYKKTFAKKLRHYMDLNTLSQVDVSNYLGCSSSLVSAWCRAEKMPRVDKITRLCNLFNIEMSELCSVESKEDYYLNNETRQIAQEIYENPDMRSLFDVSRKMSPERLKAHIEFMKKLQESET